MTGFWKRIDRKYTFQLNQSVVSSRSIAIDAASSRIIAGVRKRTVLSSIDSEKLSMSPAVAVLLMKVAIDRRLYLSMPVALCIDARSEMVMPECVSRDECVLAVSPDQRRWRPESQAIKVHVELLCINIDSLTALRRPSLALWITAEAIS